jgi:hypothetical protein
MSSVLATAGVDLWCSRSGAPPRLIWQTLHCARDIHFHQLSRHSTSIVVVMSKRFLGASDRGSLALANDRRGIPYAILEQS